MATILGNDEATQRPQIDLSQSKPMVCKHCGYDVFITGAKFRTISKLLTGTPQDAIIPIEVQLCGECGAVNESLLPKQIKDLDNTEK
jgi:hypothetical protein